MDMLSIYLKPVLLLYNGRNLTAPPTRRSGDDPLEENPSRLAKIMMTTYPSSSRIDDEPLLFRGESNLEPWTASIMRSDLEECEAAVFESNALNVKIGGRGYYLNWNYIKPSIDRFIAHVCEDASLNVDWGESCADLDGMFGRIALKSLFHYLHKPRPLYQYRPISFFKRIAISVPTTVKHVMSCDLLGRPTLLDDSIQLHGAIHLGEFSWAGDFVIFATKVKGIPFLNLTGLEMSGCVISVEDAISLLNSSPNLQKVALGTIHMAEDCGHDDLLENCELPNIVLPDLLAMKLTSKAKLLPILGRLTCHDLERLQLILIGNHTGGSYGDIPSLFPNRDLKLSVQGILEEEEIISLRSGFSLMTYNGH
jgi:hypothetical protein